MTRGSLRVIDYTSELLFNKGYMSLTEEEEKGYDDFQEWTSEQVKSGKGNTRLCDAVKEYKKERI